MSIKIDFKIGASKKTSSNLVLFVDEKYNTNPLKKYISSEEFSYISDLLKTSDLTKNMFATGSATERTLFIFAKPPQTHFFG